MCLIKTEPDGVLSAYFVNDNRFINNQQRK